jgi:hypothetical protein
MRHENDAPEGWPWLLVDTLTETVAGVYAERADADAKAAEMNIFSKRYVVEEATN